MFVRIRVNWAFAKNDRKTNKIALISRFWELFDIKESSRVEGSKLNTSGVNWIGWNNWRGSQNWSLLSVSKNERKTNKIARFSWFWALFAIKQWSRVEASYPNTSGLDLLSWKNKRGCQNWSLLSVSKNERKTNKNASFSWFWVLFVIKQWSRVEGNSHNASGVVPDGWNNWRGCQNLS